LWNGIFIWIVVRSDWCDIKFVNVLWKSENVLFCGGFFYLNSNKKLLMWCKKCKKVRMFLIWFFGRSEKGIENLSMGCQTASLLARSSSFPLLPIKVNLLNLFCTYLIVVLFTFKNNPTTHGSIFLSPFSVYF
jgi:hypothetical protein